MLPIAVLPVAGLLLRLGQADLLNIKWIADAGGTIFTNLPLIFAIGVAVGFAKENHGAAALAGGIGYLILTPARRVCASRWWTIPWSTSRLSGPWARVVLFVPVAMFCRW
jgi:phosphotransferase system  glucose/maltose/N-acetylglucosamine-specific IIC component